MSFANFFKNLEVKQNTLRNRQISELILEKPYHKLWLIWKFNFEQNEIER